MIRSHRALHAPTLGASHEITAWVERDARIHAFRTEQLVCDDRLFQRGFGRTDDSARKLITIVLRGRLFLESGSEVWCCSEGQGLYLPNKGALSVRTDGPRYESIVLEWTAKDQGSPQCLSFDPTRFSSLFAELLGSSVVVDATLDALLAALSSLVPSARVAFSRAPTGTAEPRAQEVADALDAALSALGEQPMLIDLEARLGVSSRQVIRLVEGFRARYGYGSTNWQQARGRRRLMLAATLLTAPRASVAEVARVVGYRHPETLTHAFGVAGLPRPSQIRREVQSLEALWTNEAAPRSPSTERGSAPPN